MYNQSFDIKAMSLLSLGLKTILVSANAHGSYFDRTIIQKNLNSAEKKIVRNINFCSNRI